MKGYINRAFWPGGQRWEEVDILSSRVDTNLDGSTTYYLVKTYDGELLEREIVHFKKEEKNA